MSRHFLRLFDYSNGKFNESRIGQQVLDIDPADYQYSNYCGTFMDIIIESKEPEVVMESKRYRSPNFSPAERNKLLSLILGEKEIVDNKKTGVTFWREKEESWQRISDKFNAGVDSSNIRTTNSLKKYFENQKKALRQMLAKNKLENMASGVPVPLKLTRDDHMLLEFLEEKPSVEMCSISSDSDIVPLDEIEVILGNSKPDGLSPDQLDADEVCIDHRYFDETSANEWRSDNVHKSNHHEESENDDQRSSTDLCECGRLKKIISAASSKKRKLDEHLVKVKLEVQILKKQKLLASKKLAERQLQIAEQDQLLRNKEMKLKLELLAEQLKLQKARTSLLINTDISL